MATPEQEAFIQEMKQKKPREVWEELWEARQKLKGVGTPDDITQPTKNSIVSWPWSNV